MSVASQLAISITFAHPHIEFIALYMCMDLKHFIAASIMSDTFCHIMYKRTCIHILHSPTSLFITLCCMYVFLHLSGEEHTGCHSWQEEAVSLWGDRNWSSAHCGSLHHHEPGICWQDRTARESQGSLQVRQAIVRFLYVWLSPVLYSISSPFYLFTSSLSLLSPFSFSLPPLHPSSPPSSTILQPPPPCPDPVLWWCQTLS